MIEFEWNQAKSRSNQKKQGVTFDEAQTVFYDDFAIQFYDETNSSVEDRFLMLGRSIDSRLLLVCHCEREDSHNIRIISTRKATKSECKYYSGEML
jgi:uncharacterized DUF497 family protein